MDLMAIKNNIIPAIQEIGIKKIIFTGGEPTMHDELPVAIQMVKMVCKDVQVGITTNGYNLKYLIGVEEYIDRITVSTSSLKKEIFMRYTMIDPQYLIEIMKQFNSVKKSVSIVITEENVNEIEDLITLFTKNSFDIKLQFVISQLRSQEDWERKIIHHLFNIYGKFDISMGATPVLYKTLKNGATIKIKVSSLNTWTYDNIFVRKACMNCKKKKECVERGCAIRIFPDGTVTPCLNQFKYFTSKDVIANLETAYQVMQII